MLKSSSETSLSAACVPQGIIGADNRHYALDLFRVFPPDANFSGEDEQGKFRHKLAVLRPELVEQLVR